jgi:hypothetical protein
MIQLSDNLVDFLGKLIEVLSCFTQKALKLG